MCHTAKFCQIITCEYDYLSHFFQIPSNNHKLLIWNIQSGKIRSCSKLKKTKKDRIIP
jgi:hypothetical protein